MVLEQLQSQRIVLLERAAQTVAHAHLVVHQVTTLLGQASQSAHGRACRIEWWELLWMSQQQLKRPLSITRVILGTAGYKGAPIPGQGCGIDRKQHQEIIFLK